ncbi:ankyrin repeat domain-containing protein [Pseudomonas sp. CAN2814]|uniref:ankyrin repeat domain-containing protein n=1 Tax=Pseudomonas sp. CAN1 TaxID=3046726 RepID=UPI00264A3BD2|nr:ankyrin repeat domain-containing protein [Pseudomonas sp. CAN1]MDN6858087.1 ankyrin repeat domain-containing protein [Pseudomonas sp. CAN1]
MRTLKEIFTEIESVPDYFGHQISSVDYQNGWGDTPLHIVSCWGDCEAIKMLVEAGADINKPGETGFTPLHCAVEQDHPQAVALLLALGAKALPDANGLLPSDLARLLNHDDVLKLLNAGC